MLMIGADCFELPTIRQGSWNVTVVDQRYHYNYMLNVTCNGKIDICYECHSLYNIIIKDHLKW